MRRAVLATLSLLVLAAAAGTAHAHSYKFGSISVGHVWAPRPAPGAAGLPVYGPILNRGDEPHRLVGATTPIADEARFRVEENGEVRWPETVELQPMKPVALAPWAVHIWLSGLKRKLQEGDSFALTLDFGELGEQTVEIVVEKASGH